MNTALSSLDNLFIKFLKKNPIFKDKKALQANYTPKTIPHRDAQIEQLAKTLAPILRGQKPSNIFIYGKTGTGKTLTVLYTTNTLSNLAQRQHIPLSIIYTNCKLKKNADTEYRLIAYILAQCGKHVPATGLPTQEIYKIFSQTIDREERILLLILDEVDQLAQKSGNDVFYTLTRMNAELQRTQIALIGISNDLRFTESLDARTRSSLSEEDLLFPAYNALQLQDILRSRAQTAFHEDALTPGVIEKCAAYAAREHGDARRSLELLRVAGESAEREGSEQVFQKHLDDAAGRLERERVLDMAHLQPKLFQLTLYTFLQLVRGEPTATFFTGDIYEQYRKFCAPAGMRPVTQRRFSDILAELDMLGLIHAQIISKGRGGRMRKMSTTLSIHIIEQLCEQLQTELELPPVLSVRRHRALSLPPLS